VLLSIADHRDSRSPHSVRKRDGLVCVQAELSSSARVEVAMRRIVAQRSGARRSSTWASPR